jgi:hypothetical protein
MISWLDWLVGWFGMFVWPFHGYSEVCCMVFLTGHWSDYLGFWLMQLQLITVTGSSFH